MFNVQPCFYSQKCIEVKKSVLNIDWESLLEERWSCGLDLKEYEELRWSDLSQDTLNMNIENSELLSHI